jgi:hypothetical protein
MNYPPQELFAFQVFLYLILALAFYGLVVVVAPPSPKKSPCAKESSAALSSPLPCPTATSLSNLNLGQTVSGECCVLLFIGRIPSLISNPAFSSISFNFSNEGATAPVS